MSYPDPFREGGVETQPHSGSTEGLFLPPTTTTTTTTTSGSGPQSLSLSQGSIGANAGAGLTAPAPGSTGAVAGLVKYESDTSALSLQQHHHHLQAPSSPTQPHHPRAHRRNEGLVTSDMSLTSDVRAWNPFNDMTPFSQMSEDNIFGAEFDKIRRGSQSSISNVKSRESLVMSTEDDPFGAAPFIAPGSRRMKTKGGSDPRMNSSEDTTGLTPDLDATGAMSVNVS
ncbi:hypothetical protein E2C01_000519 [Portunus trituberculatus]|uniref:Uncharacterized protein n=1 Tax=Portunus trituberculatus TaxID=210409 RepID=A0A5B7CGS3_PORTR|nr:hypothetical protein [Portunus trituberculatus]